MILVDTSIWVAHFRKSNSRFSVLLEQSEIVTHPSVIGELACGNLKNRKDILGLLRALPSAQVATDEEVHELIEVKKLMGKGIGWIYAHLLAASLISDVPLWTTDKPLKTVAATLGLSFE